MGTANVETYLPFTPDQGRVAGSVAINIRANCELLRTQMESERSSFISQWRDLNDHIRPRRGRFWVTDVDRGDRRNQKILDGTATFAARTCSAGMMSGITSPARPWFRLTTPDPELNEQEQVKEYLHEVMLRMQTVFVRSNVYNVLPIFYSDLATFGTAAFAVLEDDETVIRCYDYPVGTFCVGNDRKMRPRVFLRTFRWTVQQIVEQWGNIDRSGRPDFLRGEGTSISTVCQSLWTARNTQAWIDLVHVVRPNVSYDETKVDAKYRAFEEIYYELGGLNNPVDPKTTGLLSRSGYNEFPVLCGRWEKNSEDVYGTDCPGMTALADIRTLQLAERRVWQAAEKMVNPPMIGPTHLRNGTATTLPGGITWVDVRDGMQGFTPAYQIKFDTRDISAKEQECRGRIQKAFYEDLWLMFADSDRRQITATEVDEKKQEKLLALGPMLEQLNEDALNPLIYRTFKVMERKALLPPPPEQLQGQSLRIEYVSIMAQAQKAVAITGLERTASFISQVGQVDPTVFDCIDSDELVRQYVDANGNPPKILRSEDAIAQIRAQRAQQQQANQTAENAPKLAGAAQSLAAIPAQGDTMLSRLAARRVAQGTLSGTTAPPVPISGLQS